MPENPEALPPLPLHLPECQDDSTIEIIFPEKYILNRQYMLYNYKYIKNSCFLIHKKST